MRIMKKTEKRLGVVIMSERDLKLNLEDRLPDICKLLIKGKDVEIRRDASGIKVISVDKKVVAK